MKQENFLFVDIVSAIFLLLLMVGNLFGLLYITDGNFPVSVLISLFIVVCYYFVIQLLKRNKEKMVNKSFMVPETLFFFVFIIFGLASLFFLTHFINVEMNAKDKIIADTDAKIQELINLPEAYKEVAENEVLEFDGDLSSKLQAYKSNPTKELKSTLLSTPYSIDSLVLNTPSYINVREVTDSKLELINYQINQNYKELDESIVFPAEQYQKVFLNWQRMNVVSSYEGLNSFIERSYASVNEKLDELPREVAHFEYEEGIDTLPLNDPIALNEMYKPDYIIPSVSVVLLHLFILIPFFTHRVRKYNKTNKEKGEIKGGHRI